MSILSSFAGMESLIQILSFVFLAVSVLLIVFPIVFRAITHQRNTMLLAGGCFFLLGLGLLLFTYGFVLASIMTLIVAAFVLFGFVINRMWLLMILFESLRRLGFINTFTTALLISLFFSLGYVGLQGDFINLVLSFIALYLAVWVPEKVYGYFRRTNTTE